MAANPKDAIVRKQVKAVHFSFLTDQDTRQRSVGEITSPQAFDSTLSTPLPNGLYDPRLGPTSSKDTQPCITCGLRAIHCPGHAGHIELAVPVYHPLLIKELVQLLKAKCWNCHQIKLPTRLTQTYKAKFYLLETQQIDRLQQLDNELKVASHDKVAAAVAADAMDQVLIKYQPNGHAPQRRYYNSYERQIRQELVMECRKAAQHCKACAHCGAHSPKVRHDSYNKLFQAPLSKKLSQVNSAHGVELESAQLKITDDGYNSDDTTTHMVNDDDDDDDKEETDGDNTATSRDRYLPATEVLAQVQRTWEKEPYLLNAVFGAGFSNDKESYQIYFLQAVPVPPSRFRPPMYLGGMSVEHSQTQYLAKMLQLNESLRQAFVDQQLSKAYSLWIDLQTTVNCFMDSSKDPSAMPPPPGIQQLLERKQGLFRQHMMGKRVDYACRSVISPDPYIGTNEIGLPRYFCTVLTYPVPVTERNVKEMRIAVERGPHQYPGARWVEVQGKRVDLSKMTPERRSALAAQLLTHVKKGAKPAIVGRQLRDGDYVLMNRQPTLHKPGIMAHRVRVLHNPTQKTIRMHYANCNTYNADFDGDEMNCHFPQSDLARAEAEYIARTDLQYIVPTDGSPLRGLIQDHVVGGVMLTKRDTFLEKWQYQQLIFAALVSLPGNEIIRSDVKMELVPPAILKPQELWTGKQVITTLLLHLRKGNDRDNAKGSNLPGISNERKAKTPGWAFGESNEEHLVLIRDGELLRGVLDKSAFGATEFSLVHAVYEAYGPEKAGLLLNSFGRLFTAYIQFYSGHSCRMEDLILTKEADAERRKLVDRAYNIGSRAAKAWADSEGGKVSIPDVSVLPSSDLPLKPVEAASASATIGKLLSGNEGKDNFAALDAYMQSQLNPLSSEIVKKCLPSGLAVPFPYNSFGVMTTTGAKGSIVNQSQVTCALGQQALEGRRVPRLNSGRTLPSFAPYDPNPRADGFVMDRFLTGIRPQEYYFHCMAGREGLVDTAVKTSRSGYLQRCLMKHLEELKVHYDYTVRNAEGGVVQFLYGEDALDPTKAAYLDCTTESFAFMARNHDSLKRQRSALPLSAIDMAATGAKCSRVFRNDDDTSFNKGDQVLARRLKMGDEWKRGMLCQGWHEARVLKVHKTGKTVDLEYMRDGKTLQKVPIRVNLGFCGGKTEEAISSVATLVKHTAGDPVISTSTKHHGIGRSGSCVSERIADAVALALEKNALRDTLIGLNLSQKDFGALVAAKYSSSLCDPGEAVGSIAAQSIGEPSTQMTLNTFHLAGAGANVTLGIPRLREIIMTASRELKTPTMSIPLNETVTEKDAIRTARDFSRLTLMELISGERGISVTETLEQEGAGNWSRAYYITIKLYQAERIKAAFGLSIHDVAKVIAKNFVPLLSSLMKKELKRAGIEGDGVSEVEGGQSSNYIRADDGNEDGDEENIGPVTQQDELNDDDQDDMDDDDAPGEEDGADASRYRSRRKESISYDDDDSNADQDDNIRRVSEEVTIDGNESATPTSTSTPFAKNDSMKVNERTNTIILQPLRVDPATRPLLMVGLVETAASSTLVRSRRHINKAFINLEEGRGLCLQTAGVNFEELWKLTNVDHSRLISNDIWAIRCAYGVEASRRNIVNQIKSVFGAYGIEIDPRHLSIIADYMTFDGGFKAMNRIGMEATSSVLLQMSFETTVHFLRQAALANDSDDMNSPSANLVCGEPIKHGTGSFALMSK